MSAPSPPALRAGPANPVPTTPPRRPGSLRRTISFDMTGSGGLTGSVVADIRGHDVLSAPDGSGSARDELAMELHIDLARGVVTESQVTQADTPLPDLAGIGVGGLGRRLAELHPEEQRRRPLAFSALEDLGGALLVSGYAPLHAGTLGMNREQGERRARAQADVCAGWATGTPVLETLRLEGFAALPIGPQAPELDTDDALDWHAMAPLGHPTVRRLRRLDVLPTVAEPDHPDPTETGHAPGALTLQSHLRDSFAAQDGELVMHEYLLDADLDADRVLTAVSVQPRVLPWYECPAAVNSAERVVGTPLCDIPARVRGDFTGRSTCTHLNSTLRCLVDADSLAADLLETTT